MQIIVVKNAEDIFRKLGIDGGVEAVVQAAASFFRNHPLYLAPPNSQDLSEAEFKALEAGGFRWNGGTEEQDRDAGTQLPGVFGVFYYKSPNPRTMEVLSEFFPAPGEEITREFREGASAEEICARSIRSLRALGIRNIYLSNLPIRKAARTVERILRLV